MVNVDDVNIMGGSVHTSQNNKESFLVGSKETGLEVNADKTKCMIMSRNQNVGRSHHITFENSSFERVEEFKYMLTSLTYQNSIQEEVKSRLKSGNGLYHSVQNLLSSSLLSRKLKITIYRSIIFLVVLYGCETWSLKLREERRPRGFENRVLRRVFGPKRDVVTGEWGKLNNEELNDLYYSPNIFRVIKSRRMRWAGNVTCMWREEVY